MTSWPESGSEWTCEIPSPTTRRAQKLVLLGAADRPGPVVDQVFVDGTAVDGDGMRAATGLDHAVEVTVSGTGDLTFAWYSSAGDLENYRSAAASLFADAPAHGTLVIVVRDSSGGVDWKVLEVAFE